MPTSVAIPVAGDHELACPAGDVGLHVHHIGAVRASGLGQCRWYLLSAQGAPS